MVKANSYLEGADAISTLLGPVLAGITLSTAGVAWVLGTDAISYLISFLGLIFLSYNEKQKNA
ncbi:hypothetical protein [Falsibacillus pallidus]|uniref:hypothetical protein n=1 Tax=Falsibacillus pallidus TaxID=493781 RepID=UPI003D978EE5